MIRLHASYGLKVPAEQEYSSQSFHATAEIELADATNQDPQALRRALHGLWNELKTAVGQEINGNAPAPTIPDATVQRLPSNNAPPAQTQQRGGNGRSQNGAAATKKQIGFLLSLFRRHRNMSADQVRSWMRESLGQELNDLTKSQAGSLIDELNAAA